MGEAKEKVVVRWTEEECREEARVGWNGWRRERGVTVDGGDDDGRTDAERE